MRTCKQSGLYVSDGHDHEDGAEIARCCASLRGMHMHGLWHAYANAGVDTLAHIHLEQNIPVCKDKILKGNEVVCLSAFAQWYEVLELTPLGFAIVFRT